LGASTIALALPLPAASFSNVRSVMPALFVKTPSATFVGAFADDPP
jgi:hypothetical protein